MGKILKITMMVVLLVVIMTINVDAHRMLIDLTDNNQLKVSFDDGTAAADVKVTLYDETGEVLLTGQTDGAGVLNYDAELNPQRIVAQDEMGHRAVLSSDGSGQGLLADIPDWIRIIIGLGVVSTLAAGMMFIKAKKQVNN